MHRQRALPLVILALALAGIAIFSRGLGVADTAGLLVCGAVAGASLAAIADPRRRTR
jgi:UPF0716 family protein affecting phage T7 exclusion